MSVLAAEYHTDYCTIVRPFFCPSADAKNWEGERPDQRPRAIFAHDPLNLPIQQAMVEVHGSIAEAQFTGNYDRHCWEYDPFEMAGWCSPLAGQQELYLPAYFRTEFKTVFVGEHTSYTHSWIWSSLESAVRGTAQLLLDMRVDEAMQITETWMARWISVLIRTVSIQRLISLTTEADIFPSR